MSIILTFAVTALIFAGIAYGCVFLFFVWGYLVGSILMAADRIRRSP